MIKLEIGQTESFSKTISESDVYQFAGIVGDYNSVHVNKEMAEKSHFGERIVHGMLVGSFISTVLGMKLPGDGTVYLEQNLKFVRPVYFGDTITAIVTVAQLLNENKGIWKLETQINNQHGQMVVDGYAVVKYKENNADE